MARTLVFKRTVRQQWNPEEPQRIVLLAAVDEGDGTITGEVWASVGNVATKVQSVNPVEADRRARVVTLPDGSVWRGPAPGCSCNVPRSLKGFNPLR